jgi:hypothetical protein
MARAGRRGKESSPYYWHADDQRIAGRPETAPRRGLHTYGPRPSPGVRCKEVAADRAWRRSADLSPCERASVAT